MWRRSKLKCKYLIIGNSAGAIGAVEAIRKVDSNGSITLVSDESNHVYSRPMISHYVRDIATFDEMLYRPKSFYDDQNVNTLFGKKVVKLQIDEWKAVLDDGQEIEHKSLLLATGGKPIIPKIKGLDKNGVHSFTTISDAKAIRERVEQPATKKAVVLGGGLIGLLAAEALLSRMINVTVVELSDRLLGPVLDPTASTIMARKVEQSGLTVITGHTISEVLGVDEICGVMLDDGRKIDCELLILGVGVTPNTQLALDSDLKVNRGIIVNKRMETTTPSVYACGDCAEPYDFAYDSFRPTPIWPAAYRSGAVAGSNMAGLESEYDNGTCMNSMDIFDFPVISVGRFNPGEDEGCDILYRLDEAQSVYRKVVLNKNRIIGAILAGEIEKAGIILSLMKNKVDASEFKEALNHKDFGLAYLPVAIRNKMFRVKKD